MIYLPEIHNISSVPNTDPTITWNPQYFFYTKYQSYDYLKSTIFLLYWIPTLLLIYLPEIYNISSVLNTNPTNCFIYLKSTIFLLYRIPTLRMLPLKATVLKTKINCAIIQKLVRFPLAFFALFNNLIWVTLPTKDDIQKLFFCQKQYF